METIYSAKNPPPGKPKTKSKAKPMRDAQLFKLLAANTTSSSRPVSAFVVQPKAFRFETQEKEEKVLLLLRAHVITNLVWIGASVLMLFLPILLSYVPFFIDLPLRYQTLMVLGWYVFTFGFAFEQFLLWYFNVYIITDERVIDYDFYSLLSKRVSEAKIDRIEDVTYKMDGVSRSIFNYGSIFIQTAGEEREFDFIDVPQPDLVVKLLNELMIEEEREVLEGRVR